MSDIHTSELGEVVGRMESLAAVFQYAALLPENHPELVQLGEAIQQTLVMEATVVIGEVLVKIKITAPDVTVTHLT